MDNQNNNFFIILFFGMFFIYLINKKPKIIYKL